MVFLPLIEFCDQDKGWQEEMYSALNDRGAEETAHWGKIVLFPIEVHTEATQTIFFMFLFVCLIVFLSNDGGF